MTAYPSPAGSPPGYPAVPGGSRPTPTGLSERWFRACPDSSIMDRPRLLARSLIDVADLDEQIAFYQRLLGVPADLRMPIPDFGGLELAAVGGLLLIASERPFTPIQRQTVYSLIVPSLRGALERLERLGGTILEPPEDILPGSRARVRYPDGCLAELVEHRPQPGEKPRPQAAGPRNPLPGARLLARRPVHRDALDAALAYYTGVLETQAARVRPGGLAGAELAIVGNLLLVASDTGPAADEPAFALILTRSAAAARGVAAGPVPRLIALADGRQAEVWDKTDVPAG